jgi:hypothetical protein
MYRDLFIILIVLVSLLTLISTLGGSVRFNMERFVPTAVDVPPAATCAAASCGGAGAEHFAGFAANDLDIKETYVRLDEGEEDAAEAEAEAGESFEDAAQYADEDAEQYQSYDAEDGELAEGEGFEGAADAADAADEGAGEEEGFHAAAPLGFDGDAFGFAEWSTA